MPKPYIENQLQPQGTKVRELRPLSKPSPSDLFIISTPKSNRRVEADAAILNDQMNGRVLLDTAEEILSREEKKSVISSDYDSHAVSYATVLSSIENLAISKNHIGSMAYKDKNDYSRVDHNHDDVYSRFSAESYYDDPEPLVLMTFNISSFTENGELVEETVQLKAPQHGHIVDKNEPDIGTLRFICIPTLSHIPVMDYGDHVNIDIFSDDFDGWVFPNGTTFAVEPGEFRRAVAAYGSQNGFTVPDLRNFIKLNPGIKRTNSIEKTQFKNCVPPHTHKLLGVSADGTSSNPTMQNLKLGNGGQVDVQRICGHGNSTVNGQVTFTASAQFFNKVQGFGRTLDSNASLDVETKPSHNIMPVMIYIGHVYD